MDRMPAANTQYKTVGVQWFASICSRINFLQRWIQTRSENPTVSYCQTLCATLKDDTDRKRTEK